MKPSLSVSDQVALVGSRGLQIDDTAACLEFFSATNYYRFSGYARYFQQAPHLGDDTFLPGSSFTEIRELYNADEELRSALMSPLAGVELLLRTHVARVIADSYGPYGTFLDPAFYTNVGSGESTVESCLRDIERSRERHILRFKPANGVVSDYRDLPIWSAVEAWSFGTLSKVIERGGQGALHNLVSRSLGVAKAGFPYRVKALVYLRNRCAHHSRLWNHSVVDSGPTPNNVRVKAKRLAGQFEARSVIDVLASLDDLLKRGQTTTSVLVDLVSRHPQGSVFLRGLAVPKNPRDHAS